ncbi:uncharacterized protein LOC131936955 isoform X1 [Physella acuta]|uniref:uncharacterized protein LOC131936955 isoform X1 n=1 Tax=Physella acuta TaxID=109671 RepID=UPI0027DB0BDE|nr:uncharacterized protein LOC131936955 isoform X1 [Physella acuta]
MGLIDLNKSTGTSNPFKICANIFIAFVGAGVLGLPYAFKEAGILEGVFIIIIVAVLSVKAMLLIVECKYRIVDRSKSGEENMGRKEDSLYAHFAGTKEEKADLLKTEGDMMTRIKDLKPFLVHDLTYGDIGYEAIGPTGRILVDFALVLSQIGFSCAYLIFICENLSSLIPKIERTYWLLIVLPPLSFLTMFRNLSSLAITSLIAQCSNLFAFGIVFWFDFKHASKVRIHPKEISLANLPFFAVIAIYCYEGAGLILSLENSLAKEVKSKFNRYFLSTIGLLTVLYISFGVFGYMSFGAETKQIITLNLPNVMMFPVMKVLEHYFILDPDRSVWKGNVMRGLVVLLTGVIVVMIPNFVDLMALVGASCCTLLAFILPGLFHLKLFKGKLNKKQILLNWLLVLFGIIGATFGMWDAFIRLSGSQNNLPIPIPETTTLPTKPVNVSATSSPVLPALTNLTTTTVKNLDMSTLKNLDMSTLKNLDMTTVQNQATSAKSVLTLIPTTKSSVNQTALSATSSVLNSTLIANPFTEKFNNSNT